VLQTKQDAVQAEALKVADKQAERDRAEQLEKQKRSEKDKVSVSAHVWTIV